MSSKYRNLMVVLCLSAFVGLFAGVAAAETVYLYDFDNLEAGTLVSQDNWEHVTGSGTIAVKTASGPWTEKYLDDASGVSTQDKRVNDGTWAFTLVNDEDFDMSVKALAIGSGTDSDLVNGGIQQRLVGEASPFHWLLAGTKGQNLEWRLCLNRADYDAGAYDEFLAHNVAPGEEKIFLVGFKGTATATSGVYSMQPYYQNLTDGGAKTNHGSPFNVTFADLSNEWDSLQARLTGNGEMSDIRITSGQVPEPSTLALLGCGLVGLLAYAWRKRK